jgi:nucleotide-binding universal stress UspA family protein
MKRFIVPLDGSELAARVLPHVERLAQKGDAITLVTVEELLPPPSDPIKPGAFHAGRLETLKQSARMFQGKGFMVETALAYGPAVENILRCAKEIKADTLVISSHGRTGVQRVLYGSVAQRLIGSFEGEIIVVRPPKASLKA